jgi:hypothetical protein
MKKSWSFLGGQFRPKLGGQFAPKLVVNLHWKWVVNLTVFSKFVIPQLKATDLLIETAPASFFNIPDIGNREITPERQEAILREEIQRINDELESKY